jgi:hypothetical protein
MSCADLLKMEVGPVVSPNALVINFSYVATTLGMKLENYLSGLKVLSKNDNVLLGERAGLGGFKAWAEAQSHA